MIEISLDFSERLAVLSRRGPAAVSWRRPANASVLPWEPVPDPSAAASRA